MRLFLGFFVLMMCIIPAAAQTIAPPSFVQSLGNQVSLLLVEGLAALIGIALTWAIAQFASTQAAIKAKTGLDIEAILRAALHQALTTGAQTAINGGLNGPAAVNAVVAHANASVPGAIEALGPSGTVLMNLAKAKLAEVLAATRR